MNEMVGDLSRARRITAEDVKTLRREVWPDGVISADEAKAIFKLDHACREKDQAWVEFYVEALTNYFVWQSEPRGYLDGDRAQELMDHILHDEHIDDMTELELLLNIIYWAESVPEELSVLVLLAARESVLEPATAAYGSNRPPGVISSGDVAVMRRAIFGSGSLGSITVTRREAEVIFDLNDATRGEDNAEEWQKFFVQSIANHLMFPRPAPRAPSAAQVKRQQQFLAERDGVGHFLAGIGQAFARRDIASFSEAWKMADPFNAGRARREAEQMEEQTREAFRREAIDPAEANWLSERIMRDGTIDDNERALLQFIKDNATAIDNSLRPLFDKAGV